jgi:hypothetical protein
MVTDLFPWQENGVQFKRTWPIGDTQEVLRERWDALFKVAPEKRGALLRESRDLNAGKALKDPFTKKQLLSLLKVNPGDPPVIPLRYAYRSFDRKWALLDSRLCDYPRPNLLKAHSDRQVYLTSLLTKVLGEGPAAVATSHIPDMDYFCNRGARDVIPLWLDAEAKEPNITAGTLAALAQAYGQPVTAEDIFAYCYAVMASPDYVRRFWDELTIPGPRLPLTKDAALFARTADLGRRLLWLHTYGERFIPAGHKPGRIPPGEAKCLQGTPAAPEKYPEKFSYDLAGRQVHVGEGVFGPVRPEVWELSVSGFQVVQHWLAHRMKKGAGKKSSPLDQIRPAAWQFDEELLDLLWVLEHTVDLWPPLAQALNDILAGDLFTASDFPEPQPEERAAKGHLPLLGAVAPDETEVHENNG